MIASNPVTRPNMGPFGSIAHITADIDYEASTLEQVGELEWKLFHALLPGGLTGELGPQMEAVMGEHR